MLIIDPSSTCGLCEEAYSRDNLPHCIPCGHVTCAPCLSKITAPTRCPFCREYFSQMSVRKFYVDMHEPRPVGAGANSSSTAGSIEANGNSKGAEKQREPESLRRRQKQVASATELIQGQQRLTEEARGLEEKLARVVRRGAAAEIADVHREIQDWIIMKDKSGVERNAFPVLRALVYLTFCHLNSNVEQKSPVKTAESKFMDGPKDLEESLKKEKRRRELKELECQDLRNDCMRLKEELERSRKELELAYAVHASPESNHDVSIQTSPIAASPDSMKARGKRSRSSTLDLSESPYFGRRPPSPSPFSSNFDHHQQSQTQHFQTRSLSQDSQSQTLIAVDARPSSNMNSSNLSLSISVSTYDHREGQPTNLGSFQMPMPMPATVPMNIPGKSIDQPRPSSPVAIPGPGQHNPERKSSTPISFEKRFADNNSSSYDSSAYRPGLHLSNPSIRDLRGAAASARDRSQTTEISPPRLFPSSSYDAPGFSARFAAAKSATPNSTSSVSVMSSSISSTSNPTPSSSSASRLIIHGAPITHNSARHFISYYVARFGISPPEMTLTLSDRDSSGSGDGSSSRAQWWQAVMNTRGRRIGFGCGSSREAAQNNCYIDAAHYVESLLPTLWTGFRDIEEGVVGATKAMTPLDELPPSLGRPQPSWSSTEVDANSASLQEQIRTLGEDLERIRVYAAKCNVSV